MGKEPKPFMLGSTAEINEEESQSVSFATRRDTNNQFVDKNYTAHSVTGPGMKRPSADKSSRVEFAPRRATIQKRADQTRQLHRKVMDQGPRLSPKAAKTQWFRNMGEHS